MIVIKLKGGLGNQMFQFALGSILSKQKNVPLKLDHRFFEFSKHHDGVTEREFELHVFDNEYIRAIAKDINLFEKPSLLNKIKRKYGFTYPKKYTEPPDGKFQKSVLDLHRPAYLNGYFQSYKYYLKQESFVKSLFQFPLEKLDQKNNLLLETIRNSVSISVHIRRGDYLALQVSGTYEVCSTDYYSKAVHQLTSKYSNATVVFFSDDMDWVKETFGSMVHDKIFVESNTGKKSWIDLSLMSNCHHNIIANSSFSWWAAWLNPNPNKEIIAPAKWFMDREKQTNDLLPPEWIQL